MRYTFLKWVRVAVAVLFFGGLSLSFVDFSHAVPDEVAAMLASAQFVPALISACSGAVLAIAVTIFLVALTLVAGRIYCSAICPLGILQDVVSRVAGLFRRKPMILKYAPAQSWLRYSFLGLAVVTIPLGGAGWAIAWLDPYSHFGRIFSMLVRPAVMAINNGALWLAEKGKISGLFHAEIALAPLPLVIGVALFFVLIVGLAAWRGRIYCNTICPVGTLLGLFSRYSLLKLKINAETCGKCAECLKSCKAQCIDLKSGAVDHSRCVACFNCLVACDRSAMQVATSWTPRVSKPDKAGTNGSFDSGRRQFLLTATAGALVTGASVVPAMADPEEKKSEHEKSGHGKKRKFQNVITPPLAGTTESFLERCTACQLCVSACPTGVLQPSLFEYGAFHLLKPRMDYERSFCNYTCNRCTEVCPSGALPLLPVPQKQVTRLGMAHFKQTNCIVYKDNTDCGACSEHCPTKAVHMVPFRDGLVIPEVEKSLCIGCGACEFACPAEPKAILVHGAPKSKQARRPDEKPAVKPVSKDGFPF